MKLYMFRTIPLSIFRSFSPYTQQWYMSYRFVDNSRVGSQWSCSVWHIPLLCVRWETPDDGQGYYPKHVEFHFKIKFEKISASTWFSYKNIDKNLSITSNGFCIINILVDFYDMFRPKVNIFRCYIYAEILRIDTGLWVVGVWMGSVCYN
jgi:hypothetical protein